LSNPSTQRVFYALFACLSCIPDGFAGSVPCVFFVRSLHPGRFYRDIPACCLGSRRESRRIPGAGVVSAGPSRLTFQDRSVTMLPFAADVPQASFLFNFQPSIENPAPPRASRGPCRGLLTSVPDPLFFEFRVSNFYFPVAAEVLQAPSLFNLQLSLFNFHFSTFNFQLSTVNLRGIFLFSLF
jgi:hypothetical protein